MQYVPGVFLNRVYGLVPRRWDYNGLSTLHAYFRFGISNRDVFVILMKCTGIMIYPSVLGNGGHGLVKFHKYLNPALSRSIW